MCVKFFAKQKKKNERRDYVPINFFRTWQTLTKTMMMIIQKKKYNEKNELLMSCHVIGMAIDNMKYCSTHFFSFILFEQLRVHWNSAIFRTFKDSSQESLLFFYFILLIFERWRQFCNNSNVNVEIVNDKNRRKPSVNFEFFPKFFLPSDQYK